MRCRKARSLLSIYCNGELTGRQQTEVKEHLAGCATCRKEAATYQVIRETGKALPAMQVKTDFNARLLNRVAQERFAETRTQAFLPKRAPLFQWQLAVPAVATVALAVVIAIGTMTGSDPAPQFAASNDSPDAYRTVQPVNNPNMGGPLDRNWSLHQQLAEIERFNRVADQLRSRSGFGGAQLTSASASFQPGFGQPAQGWNRNTGVQPMIKIYPSTGSATAAGEVKKVY